MEEVEDISGHHLESSGKLQLLDRLLQRFCYAGKRALLLSVMPKVGPMSFFNDCNVNSSPKCLQMQGGQISWPAMFTKGSAPSHNQNGTILRMFN